MIKNYVTMVQLYEWLCNKFMVQLIVLAHPYKTVIKTMVCVDTKYQSKNVHLSQSKC